mmetsp:Transcript_1943/g.4064  ORF Transcript_1943/g.4064 Transcript_1943/m.4064 type:complete len:369 (-) Transcript_1943:4-1110(-)
MPGAVDMGRLVQVLPDTSLQRLCHTTGQHQLIHVVHNLVEAHTVHIHAAQNLDHIRNHPSPREPSAEDRHRHHQHLGLVERHDITKAHRGKHHNAEVKRQPVGLHLGEFLDRLQGREMGLGQPAVLTMCVFTAVQAHVRPCTGEPMDKEHSDAEAPGDSYEGEGEAELRVPSFEKLQDPDEAEHSDKPQHPNQAHRPQILAIATSDHLKGEDCQHIRPKPASGKAVSEGHCHVVLGDLHRRPLIGVLVRNVFFAFIGGGECHIEVNDDIYHEDAIDDLVQHIQFSGRCCDQRDLEGQHYGRHQEGPYHEHVPDVDNAVVLRDNGEGASQPALEERRRSRRSLGCVAIRLCGKQGVLPVSDSHGLPARH